MKKNLLMLLLAVTFVPLYAQDIIVTHESERIDVNVIEVSETEVKYKKADNPDGPTFVLSTSKIASIIYKNGDVQTFKQQVVQQKSGSVTTVRDAADIVFVPGQKIERSDKRNKYYYGNIELDETLYRDFLKLTCPDAYKQYSYGNGMVWTGAIAGGLLVGMGLGLLIPTRTDIIIAGSVLSGVGLISGVTLICVGAKKANKSLNTFNNQCASSLHANVPMTLQFGVTSNGLGLALNF